MATSKESKAKKERKTTKKTLILTTLNSKNSVTILVEPLREMALEVLVACLVAMIDWVGLVG